MLFMEFWSQFDKYCVLKKDFFNRPTFTLELFWSVKYAELLC